MKKKLRFLSFCIITAIIFVACKKTETTAPPVDVCAGVTITPVAKSTNTITGQQLGTITVTSPIGATYLYSIGGAYQSSPNFSALGIGDYKLTVKTLDSCKGTITVPIIGYGAKYFAVKTLINNNCGPCHLNGTINGGANFDTDASITASWDRIKIRVVDGTPSFMPQGGQLTAADKQKVVDWVNAGHRTTD